MMTPRRYSDEERAAALAALAANGGNVGKTARQLGIPRATLQAWRDGERHPEAAESVAPKKAPLAELLEEAARDLLDQALRLDKLQAASTAQLMTAFGIAVAETGTCRISAASTSALADGLRPGWLA